MFKQNLKLRGVNQIGFFFKILQQCECVYCPDLMMLGHTGNYKSAQGNGIRTCQALHPHGPPLDHGPRGNT